MRPLKNHANCMGTYTYAPSRACQVCNPPCRPVVKRCARCTFSTCGSKLVPSSYTYFTDGLHLTPAG